MSKKGEELAKLHMFHKPSIDGMDPQVLGRFPVQGSNEIKTIRYDKQKEQVKINKKQVFENIPEDVWNFRIGGYQVLKQWLRRRRKKKVKINDIRHFNIVIGIIHKTIKFMENVNPLYLQIEENIIEAKKFKVSLEDF